MDALFVVLSGRLPSAPPRPNARADFHFSSGRSALKWLLSELRLRFNHALRVGVQAFTCEAVVHAISESGNLVTFLDVDVSTFSTPKTAVGGCSMDVFILTHLFGIPNPDYVGIAEHCRSRGIVLIEDLAQSAGASIDGHELGSLSDFAFFSFGFDKPISTYRGGMLRLGEREDVDRWKARYDLLAAESEDDGMADLAALHLMFLDTDPSLYSLGSVFPSLACATVSRRPRDYRRAHAIVRFAAGVPGYRFAEWFWAAALRRMPILIRKMSVAKQRYLSVLLADLPRLVRLRGEWLELARKELNSAVPSLSFPMTAPTAVVAPARLTVLARADERRAIIERFTAAGLEAGAFNWPYVAADLAGRPKSRHDTKSFPQSRSLVDRILNLPLWSDESWIAFSQRVR